jgi:CheY-like chemotaxis protein
MNRENVIALLVDDMFFAARIRSAAEAAGKSLVVIKSNTQLESELASSPPSLIIIDLNSTRLNALDSIKLIAASPELRSVPIVGFASHVQTELIRSARDAGCEHVLPRSAFTQMLPAIVRGELGQLKSQATS